MFQFSFNKPIKSYTMHKNNCLVKLVVPRWYSKVELGDYSFMNDNAKVHSFRNPQTVTIGKYSSIGDCEFFIDGDHNMKLASTYPFNELGLSKDAPLNVNAKPAAIVGHDVWICDGAIIYGGVTIGNGSVIAGQAVVTKDVPAYAVVAGNPAKIVKYRFDEETINKLQAVQWWNLPHEIICKELAPTLADIDTFITLANSFNIIDI